MSEFRMAFTGIFGSRWLNQKRSVKDFPGLQFLQVYGRLFLLTIKQIEEDCALPKRFREKVLLALERD